MLDQNATASTAVAERVAHPVWCRSHVTAWETDVDICHRSEPEVMVMPGDEQIVTVTRVRFESREDENWTAGSEGYELEVGESLTFLPRTTARRLGLVLLGAEGADVSE